MASYTIELCSGARVEMGHWSMRWCDSIVRSSLGPVESETAVLDESLVRVIEPGPYRLRDGRLDWADVLVTDRTVALVAARIATHGPRFPLGRLPCPGQKCRGRLQTPGTKAGILAPDVVVDLDAVLRDCVIDLPEESRSRLASGENRFLTTFEGTELEFALPTGASAAAAAEYVADDPDAKMTRAVVARILQFGGLTDRNDIERAISSGSAGILGLLSEMDDADGGIDDEIHLECSKCGRAEVVQIPFGDAAFWNGGRRTVRETRGARARRLSSATA